MSNIFEHNDLLNAMGKLSDGQKERAAALVIASKVESNGLIDSRVALACFITTGVEEYEEVIHNSDARSVEFDRQRKAYGLDD